MLLQMSLNYLEKWNKEENIPEDIFNKSTSDFEICGIPNMVLGLVALLKISRWCFLLGQR